MMKEAFLLGLRLFCKRQPFRPFFSQLLTGERLFVPHPEAVYHWEDVVVFLTPLRQYHLFDGSTVCRILDAGRD